MSGEYAEEGQAAEAMRFRIAHDLARYERNPEAARFDLSYRPQAGPLDHAAWNDGRAPRVVEETPEPTPQSM